jgi:hypothetical protein
MIIGEHEHLRLAGQSSKRRSVQDAISVAFEAGAERTRFLVTLTVAGPVGARGESTEGRILDVFARRARQSGRFSGAGPRVGVSHRDTNVG